MAEAELLLGPLLRYVDADTATVWVEADRPCEAEVVCGEPVAQDGTGGSYGPGRAGGIARTWQVCGHHYALVIVTGLTPGTTTPYRVLLDGRPVWPRSVPEPGPGSAPSAGYTAACAPSTIRTPPAPAAPGDRAEPPALRVAFGSCRWAARPSDSDDDPVGPDALDTLAARLVSRPGVPGTEERERPDVLLLLGDQVYADEISEETRQWIAARRDLAEPPGEQVADYEEYTRLYYESWLDPEVRWLLSSVPSCMIFDDHDVIDDWNTSESWQRTMRALPWWRERVVSGLMSYWVYQHLGNLSPNELEADELFAAVRKTDDATALLRDFATRADTEPGGARWSYRRDFGRTRLLMVDSRAARVLPERSRAMVDEGTAAWLGEQTLSDPGAYDHLLIGTSLPWLLPPAIHDAEQWNAALCAGERGARWARIGEALRQRADLEHWAAFPRSFDALTELIARAGSGQRAPATVCVLSGDVHHAYVAEPYWRAGAEGPEGHAVPTARVLQLTCSPVHNSVPASIKLGFRFGWSRAGRWLGRAMARHGRVRQPAIRWERTGGPWFGNQLMTLTLSGRSARLRLDRARPAEGGGARLSVVLDTGLTRDPSG